MGESNNRQSSSIGDGVWGTKDGGKTWQHLGLEETQAIGRVVVDSTNPNIVYVAAMGDLFGANPERGLFKSVDGGKTWKNVKYEDPDTRATDVAIDLSHLNIVYVATLPRRRTVGLQRRRPGTALEVYRRRPLTKLMDRLASAKDGIYGHRDSVFKASPPRSTRGGSGASDTGGGTGTDGLAARGGRGGFGAPTESSAGDNTPAAGAAGVAGGQGGGGRGGRGGPPPPPDPNASGVFRSDDGGKTWQFMSNQNQRPMYFSQIRVDPVNDQKLFVGGTPGQLSLDGGKTWRGLDGSHTDYHAFWINPKDPRIVYTGHDGGFDESMDGGLSWDYTTICRWASSIRFPPTCGVHM